jgi:putative oxidoreductase
MNNQSLISAMSTGISTRFGRWSALPLRLIVGYGFMAHGCSKLAHGPEHFAAILHAIGVPFPEIMAWANIGVELLGGFAVMIGAFVTLASIPMTILLLTAILTVHLPYGFLSVKLLAVTPTGAQFGPVGYEMNLLYIACLATLVLGGAGPLSVDGILFSQRAKPGRTG